MPTKNQVALKYEDLISVKNQITLTRWKNVKHVDNGQDIHCRTFDDVVKWFRAEPVVEADKAKCPGISRGLTVGHRLKDTMKPPYLVILDFDDVKDPLERTSRLFTTMGVRHCGITTHSQGKAVCDCKDVDDLCPKCHGSGLTAHRYRIITDHIARTWSELRDITEQLFDLLGDPMNKVTKESYNSIFWYLPSVHPDRKQHYVCVDNVKTLHQGSTRKPLRHGLTAYDLELSDPVQPDGDLAKVRGKHDPKEVKSLLEFVGKKGWMDEEQDWVDVAMMMAYWNHPEAEEILDAVSAEHAGYDPVENSQRFARFQRAATTVKNPQTLRTLFDRAMKGGWGRTPSAMDDFENWEPVLGKYDDSWEIVSGMSRAKAVAKMNERFAYVAEGNGKIVDMMPENRKVLVQMMSLPAFHGYWSTPTFKTERTMKSEEEGQPDVKRITYKPVGKMWKESKNFRRYMARDCLPPGGPEELGPETLNMWQGWGVVPDGSGSCELTLAHIHDIICSGNDEHYEWTISWLGHLFQRPWEMPGSSIVMRGEEGIGKGCFMDAIRVLCGRHGLQVGNPNMLTGGFNEHLFGRILICANEVTWGGNKEAGNTLKDLITEADGLSTSKGVDSRFIRRFWRFLIASNEHWMLQAGPSARRFQVYLVSDLHKEDLAYFGRIKKELENGGYEALLHYLQNIDLDDYPNTRKTITTDALVEQKILSFDLTNRWLMQILEDGRLSTGDNWPTEWSLKRTLYDSYVDFAKDVGTTRRSAEMGVSRRLKEIFGAEYRATRKAMTEDDLVGVYKLPPLDIARKLFAAKVLKAEYDWLGEDED